MPARIARIRAGVGIRHLAEALFLASLLVYVRLGWVTLDPSSLPILGLALALDLGALGLALLGPPRWEARTNRLAPIWGIAAWAALTHLGGGARTSLFVAGFWFEILLSAPTLSVRGGLGVTALALAALWGQQLPIGFAGGLEGPLGHLALQSSLLVLAGGLTAWLRHTWTRRQELLALQLDEQGRRLARTEEELEDARTLAALGERNARLGHGLKNAVHILRGYRTLLERRSRRDGVDPTALRGLEDAIEQIDFLARETLYPVPGKQASGAARTRGAGEDEGMDSGELRALLETILIEAEAGMPGVSCRLEGQAADVRLSVPRAVLAEVLTNLVRNGIEAMGGQGELVVRLERQGGRLHIDVRDHGPGLDPAIVPHLFRAGRTTKPGGTGMGLYLSRRLMEAHGGTLSLSTGGAGASFRITLPGA